MGSLPHYLESQARNGGTPGDEIALETLLAIRNQNAILDDTIHTELKRIADALEVIAENTKLIGYTGP